MSEAIVAQLTAPASPQELTCAGKGSEVTSMLGCGALARGGNLAPSSAGCCHSLGFRGLSPGREVAIYSGDDWKQPETGALCNLV